MKHLNPYRFYELASKLHALFNHATQARVTEMFMPLSEAQAALDSWIKGDVISLETSKAEAGRLLARLSALFSKYYIDPTSKQLKTPTGEDRIDAHELALTFTALEKFEHALAAELTHAPTYIASKRGIYSTYDLVENARACFSEGLRRIIPDASLREFDQAGRALAFGLGTAAGMHLLRSVELVLKAYYETFSGAAVAGNERSYALYLKKMAALAEDETNPHRPDKRLLQMLAQIKEHYRNPLTHSESAIGLDQAVALFGLATAAITLMCEEMTAAKEGRGVKAALDQVTAAAQDDEDDDTAKAKPTQKAGSRA